MVEAITKHNTVNGILRYINQYDDLYRPSEWIAEDLHSLVEEMKNMPTGYFEAKPRRAVGFDEIAAVVVPDNLPADLIGKLTNVGANVIEYEAGNENDRTAKLNGERVGEYKFSLSDYDETVQESEEVMRDLLVMTAAHRMTDAEAERMAKKVLGVAKGTMDTVELAKKLKNTFDYATRTGANLDLNGLNAEILSIAQQVMDSSLTIDQAHEAEVKELRSFLRSTKIALTDTQQKEAASLMGSYANYRRATFGRVNINKNGVPLDSLWSSLTEMNPVLFPADATEGDMVQILLDASMSVSPVYINELGLNAEESRQWLANEIYNAYMSLNGVQRAAKEKQALDLKLSDYRRLTKRFAAEHSAAFDEALAKVKAENAADLTRYKAEADAEAGRKIRQKVEQVEEEYRLRENAIHEMAETRIANMAEYVQAMEIKNSAYVRNVRDKLEGAIRRRSYRERIYKATNDILKKVEEPSDKKHVAQGLESTLIEFLRALQSSLSGRHYKKVANLSWRMTQAAVALERAEDNDAAVVDPELVEEMHQLAAELEGYDNIFKLSTFINFNSYFFGYKAWFRFVFNFICIGVKP